MSNNITKQLAEIIFSQRFGFTKTAFVYPFSEDPVFCFKTPDKSFYRLDHFGSSYVVEFAEDKESATNNWFEDDDLFTDTLSTEELIQQISASIESDGYNQQV